MFLRPLFFFVGFFCFGTMVYAKPPKQKDAETNAYLRSLKQIIKQSQGRTKTKRKKRLTRAQRRARDRALKQALLQKHKRSPLRFSRQDRWRLQKDAAHKTLGYRLRLFRVGIQREYWSRRMIGEIWLLAKKQPPRLLGLGALQRHQVRNLWKMAQKQLNLPKHGPYKSSHLKKLRRYFEQQGVEVIFHTFSRLSERKKP
ncbi:MAG: hypothetical protein H6728_10195 [Myxococcales bacterium]|nr:hypothetical protein [Myxococcales bacterium]MCB9643433.1 hypothetical protein [Myxococcales bacterium]